MSRQFGKNKDDERIADLIGTIIFASLTISIDLSDPTLNIEVLFSELFKIFTNQNIKSSAYI